MSDAKALPPGELILKTKAMKIYLSVMDEDPNVIFENYKKFAVNINDNTLKRRLSNLRNWADFCNEVEPLPIKSDNPFDNIDDNESKTLSENIRFKFELPDFQSHISAFLLTIPIQFLAYHVALLKNCDIDKPRNLAKSVTVE